MPSARAAVGLLDRSSTERLNTPGIDGTSRRTASPPQTKSGSISVSGVTRVSRTSARIASVRRRRRSRCVSWRPAWVRVGVMACP